MPHEWLGWSRQLNKIHNQPGKLYNNAEYNKRGDKSEILAGQGLTNCVAQ